MQPVKLLMQQCKSTSLHVHVATMSLHFNHQFKSLMYVLITMKLLFSLYVILSNFHKGSVLCKHGEKFELGTNTLSC